MKRNTLVKFNYDIVPEKNHYLFEALFPKERTYVYLGDIPQMEGHCIVSDTVTGLIKTGCHTDDFVALTDDEL